ncbi:hypothetical protein ACFCYM_34415 [Streptomyces sp. NPDC056254]|uniref:hypothetical protein n=1 Tax=Streptomyces sp. NPDC056254 TaxID=3345763 RepID=UPI0035E05E32
MILEEVEVPRFSLAPCVPTGGSAELGGGKGARERSEPLKLTVARILDSVEVAAGVLVVDSMAFGSAEPDQGSLLSGGLLLRSEQSTGHSLRPCPMW